MRENSILSYTFKKIKKLCSRLVVFLFTLWKKKEFSSVSHIEKLSDNDNIYIIFSSKTSKKSLRPEKLRES